MTSVLVGLLAALLVLPASAQVGRSGLFGVAVDEDGEPMPGVELVLTPAGDTAGREQTIQTDRRGRFSSRFLASGRYVIEVADTDTLFIQEASVEVRDAGGILLGDYEIVTHPIEGLTPIPVQGGQVTEVRLVITTAEVRERLRRQVEGGAVQGDLEELIRLYNEGQYREALARGEALREASTTELPDLLHLLGLTQARLDRHDLAEPLLRRAVELAPDEPEMTASLGTLLLEVARNREEQEAEVGETFAEAALWLGRAVEAMDPAPVPLLINHSIALEGAGQTEAAVATLERIIAEDPDNVGAYFRTAALLRQLGQPGRALEVLESMPGGGDPRAADSLYNVAVSFYNDEDYDSALAALQRAEEIAPDHALVQRLLGRVYFSRGEQAAAIVHLRRFVELAPDHPEAEMEREMVQYLEQELGSS